MLRLSTTLRTSFVPPLLRNFSSAPSPSAPSPSAADIKELRKLSGSAPLLACRSALTETYADGAFSVSAALKHLRATSVTKTKSKTAGRLISEGTVAITESGWGRAVGVSLGCETDFAAKSDAFLSFTTEILDGIPSSEGVTVGDGLEDYALMGQEVVTSSPLLTTAWDQAVLTVRENMTVRGAFSVAEPESYFATYVHNKMSVGSGSSAGTTGAVVELRMKDGERDEGRLEEVGRKLAMHCVATKPSYLSLAAVPDGVVKEETEFFLRQMRDEEAEKGGKPKPDDIKEKIVKGKVGKWMKGICLLEQEHVAEDGQVVKKVLEKEGVEVRGFIVL